MYIFLYVFWIVLNGKFNPEIALTGLVVVALIGMLIRYLCGYDIKTECRLLKKVPLFVAYVGVLSFEIVKAACTVIGIILFAGRTITPSLVTFQTNIKTKLGRFLLANSITLTPGTITVSVKGDRFTVHCLSRELLDPSPDSVFARWISRLEA